jgi:putative methionine-R-sulfoxide reductase with GAF domain
VKKPSSPLHLAGALFGLLFPAVATWIDLAQQGLAATPENVRFVHQSHPLLWIIDLAPFILGLFALYAGFRQARVLELNRELDQKVETLTQTTAELRELQGVLEGQVEQRALAAETVTEVSRRLSSMLDANQLVHEVVELLQSAFNYYYAHIYILDEEQGQLVMVGGTGEAGQTMLERGHRIPRGKGLVGRAAETNAPVFVRDVHLDSNWLSNPLLPETRAEIAVPIALGEQVLGVLDVQHNIPNGLTDADVGVLQSIANQVAIALQNARMVARLQQRASRRCGNAVGRKIQEAASLTSYRWPY